MSWFRLRRATPAPVAAEENAPADLPLQLDAQLFRNGYAQLLAVTQEDGGIESHLAALGAKRDACVRAQAQARAGALTLDDIESLLGGVFTARRRLFPALERIGVARLSALLAALGDRTRPAAQRLQCIVDAMPGAAAADRDSLRAAARMRRAAWDFAAEMLHFGDPARYPLMTRWVWDEATQSGALRELVRGADTMRQLPFTNDPGTFAGARRWLAGCMAEEGHASDVPFRIDLTLAQVYLGYVRSVAEGSLGGDFGRGTPPGEQLRKLLGIDVAPGLAAARVRKVAA